MLHYTTRYHANSLKVSTSRSWH